MNDLISRKAVLELPRNTTRNFFGEAVGETVDVKLIEALPTIGQDWIPCKKPPTENDAYLVTVHPDYITQGGGQVDILVWVDDDWFFMIYDTKTARYKITRFPDPVIAWRPLPTPYKEENK